MKKLKLLLKDDKVYARHITKINNMKMNDEAWLEELESLHARRDIRALNSSGLLASSQKISIDNNIDNQAVRSRCVEIKIRCLKQLISYQTSFKFLRKYIPARFAATLKNVGGTMTERKAVIDYVLADITGLVDRLEHVIKICDIIIDDCDQAGFTLKRINEMLDQKSRDR